VLRSGRLSRWTGDENRCFERELADRVGATRGLTLANGTVALEAALRALRLEEGCEVVVPARSFVATATSSVNAGCRPVFADVDRDTQNLTAETVAAVLTGRTRAVVCVHLAGHPCEMEPLTELCRKRGLRLVEDCAQALGARYRGRPVGAFGDAGCFSFCHDKVLTTGGEGGMLVTSDEELWQRARSYRDHGKSAVALERPAPDPEYLWVHDGPGSNLRLTEVQAAIGRVQLGKLDGWIDRRRELARRYLELLADHPLVRAPFEAPWARHAFYRLYLFLRPERLAPGWNRRRVIQEVRRAGGECGSGSCPEIYREGVFRAGPAAPDRRRPVARALGETSLALLVHPTLRDETVDRRARAIAGVLDRALGSR
jgi:dTDP-4-amino-4,6-dideoxygalactose transaminase